LSIIEVKNLKKEFDHGPAGKTLVIGDISFRMEGNEPFLALLAPFGSGKSTLLKIIAGIMDAGSGEVLLNGKKLSEAGEKIVYIPEKPSSFPWLSVKENLLTGYEALSYFKKVPKHGIEEIIDLIGLRGYEDHFPENSSIGFRFRISLGRALILDPALILIDDTLRLTDAVTKKEIHGMLRDISGRTGIQFFLATTDISEAISLSDRILVMKKKPAEIAGEFIVGQRRDKNELLDLIKSIEELFQKKNTSESINFTI